MTRTDTTKLYERNAELEQLYENTQKLNTATNQESRLQIDISGKYKKLYENEKKKTQKLTQELELAYQRIETLQDQCLSHGMLHDEMTKALEKYDY